MTIITIFLMILIVSLILGNAFLVISRNHRSNRNFKLNNSQYAALEQQAQSPLTTISTQKIADQKAEMAHKRIDRIERLLLQSGNSVLAYNLKDKIQRLDNFRANTEVELKAMKEILTDMNTTKKPREKVSNKKLHNLAFRSL